MLPDRKKASIALLLMCISVFALLIPVIAEETEQKRESVTAEATKNISESNSEPATRLVPAGITRLDEITVTAKRHEEKIFDVPYAAHVITSDDILMQKSIKTLPEALREETSIMIQKTSHGQGSPYIRGFTSFHNLMLIDGIRLNNSVFREGPNQYWNTIDPYSIERMEVIKGPGSVMYGSDAIGGTVNALTKSRKEYGEGLLYNGKAYYRYASGEKSQITRFEMSASYNDKLGITAGGSFKGFGNMSAGDDMGLLRNTKYEEVDGDIKLEYFIDKNKKLILAYQEVDQRDVPRTEKTIHSESFRGTTVGTDLKRDIDQDRSLGYIQFHWDKISRYVERAKFSLSHHNQREEQDRIKSNGTSEETGFNVDTLGLWAQFESISPYGHLSYGFDFYHDNVTSSKTSYSATGAWVSTGIQGTVGDDSTYDIFGFYFQDEISISDKLEMLIGMRYSYVALDSDKVEDPDTGNQIDITADWEGLVGNLRFMYYPSNNWNIFTGVSQGFRAPNLSDMTRFQADSTFETPTEGLDDEDFITFEVGGKADFKKWTAQASYYYTIVEDMLVRSPTGGTVDGSPEVQKKNIGEGFVNGVEAGVSYSPFKQWTTFGNFSWTNGDVKQIQDNEERDKPFDRLMPLTGRFGIRWESQKPRMWIEGQTTMVNNQDRLSLRDRTDTNRIPTRGTPGYTIYSIRGGIKVNEHFNVSIAAENLSDKSYRVHGSGQNEPGINFIFSTAFSF